MVEEVVKKLISNNETISIMEGCTGGAIVAAITSVPDSSKVLNFSAITYAHEYKARLGVDRQIIDRFTPYSIEAVRDMAYKISFFSECTYGIGVEGKINVLENNNEDDKNNKIYVSIYCLKNQKYYDFAFKYPNKEIEKSRAYIVKKIMQKLIIIMDKEKIE